LWAELGIRRPMTTKNSTLHGISVTEGIAVTKGIAPAHRETFRRSHRYKPIYAFDRSYAIEAN
jgi:hypothetical protein